MPSTAPRRPACRVADGCRKPAGIGRDGRAGAAGAAGVLIAVGLSRRLAAVGPSGAVGVLEDASNPLCLAAADHAVLRPDDAASRRQSAARPNRSAGHWNRWKLIGRRKHSRCCKTSREARRLPTGSILCAAWRPTTGRMRPRPAANFQRLQPGRFAARIAAVLAAVADPTECPRAAGRRDLGRTDKNACPADALLAIRNSLPDGRVLGRLEKLQHHLTAGRFREAVKLLSVAEEAFRRSDPDLPQRLAAVLAAGVHPPRRHWPARLSGRGRRGAPRGPAMEPRLGIGLGAANRRGRPCAGQRRAALAVVSRGPCRRGVPFGRQPPVGPGIGLVAAGADVDGGVRAAVPELPPAPRSQRGVATSRDRVLPELSAVGAGTVGGPSGPRPGVPRMG